MDTELPRLCIKLQNLKNRNFEEKVGIIGRIPDNIIPEIGKTYYMLTTSVSHWTLKVVISF